MSDERAWPHGRPHAPRTTTGCAGGDAPLLGKEQSWRTASRIRSLLTDEEARVAVFHINITLRAGVPTRTGRSGGVRAGSGQRVCQSPADSRGLVVAEVAGADADDSVAQLAFIDEDPWVVGEESARDGECCCA